MAFCRQSSDYCWSARAPREPFAITTWPSLFRPAEGKRLVMSEEYFCSQIEKPIVAASKDALPRWSACTYVDDYRRLSSVHLAHAIVLDFDSGVDMNRLMRSREEWAGCYHSSWSSTEDVPRGRLVLFVDMPVVPREYHRVWRYAVSRFEQYGQPDLQGKEMCKAWAAPGIPEDGAPYDFILGAGPPIDVREALRVMPAERKPEFKPRQFTESEMPAVERARRWLEKQDSAISGQGGSLQTARIAYSLTGFYELDETTAFELLREYNQRCQPPWRDHELRAKIRTGLHNKRKRA